MLETEELLWVNHPTFASEFKKLQDEFNGEFKVHGDESNCSAAADGAPTPKRLKANHVFDLHDKLVPCDKIEGEVVKSTKLTSIKTPKEPLVLESRTGSRVYLCNRGEDAVCDPAGSVLFNFGKIDT